MGANHDANQARFDQLNLIGLSSRQLRWLVTKSLDELRRRQGVAELAADAYYPDDLLNEFRAGAGAALNAIDAWQGRVFLVRLALDHWALPVDRAAQWIADYLDACEGWEEAEEYMQGPDRDNPGLADLLAEALRISRQRSGAAD